MADKMMVALEDLRKLAATARQMGTQDAFIDVMLQWAEGANAEITRLSSWASDMENAMERIAVAIEVEESDIDEIVIEVQEKMLVLAKIRKLLKKGSGSNGPEPDTEIPTTTYRNLSGEVVKLAPPKPRKK